MYIYKIVNTVNDKIYVGIAGNLDSRWTSHRHFMRVHPDWPLYRAMNAYGEDKFSMHFMEECDLDTILEREQYWIEQLNSGYPHGYNIDARSLKRHRQQTGITWEQQREDIKNADLSLSKVGRKPKKENTQ